MWYKYADIYHAKLSSVIYAHCFINSIPQSSSYFKHIQHFLQGNRMKSEYFTVRKAAKRNTESTKSLQGKQ